MTDPRPVKPIRVLFSPPAGTAQPDAAASDETTCPRCGESQELAKVKGCIKCLKCGYKFDCNGW